MLVAIVTSSIALMLQAGLKPPRPPVPVAVGEEVAGRWRRAPRVIYPPVALSSGVQGWADIRCSLATDGSLSDCRVLQESQPDYGFGDAGLEAMMAAQLAPGIQTPFVRQRIHFRLGD